MTTNRPLTLRIDANADPQLIAGWVCDERGDERYFEGWLGLFTLLQQTLWRPTDASTAGVAREQEVVKPAKSQETRWITARA
jgi:hypothetical protein